MSDSTVPSINLLNGFGPRVFVTDFDGTMTAVDFFDVVLENVPAESMPDFWGRCVAGELTHVEALSGIFQQAPHDEAILESWLPQTRLDPRTPEAIAVLRAAGWDVLVVSAGCQWYIERILSEVRDQVQIIANPGAVSPETGLWMGWPPAEAPWYSAHFGVDKAAIIRTLQTAGKTVAFAGDGRPDLAAAREVAAEQRFARSWLAEQLEQQQLSYQRFELWSDIARMLVS